MPKWTDIKINDEINGLVLLEHTGIDKNRMRMGLFKCYCGKIFDTQIRSVLLGDARSCGCLQASLSRSRLITHDMSGSPEFKAWLSLFQRCYNKNCKAYKNYGGRGIRVCYAWYWSFAKFYEDMGDRPGLKYTLDRIDNNGPYRKNNCRWSTWRDQARNKRQNHLFTHNQDTKPICEWSEITGISAPTIIYRIKAGWDNDKILITPTRPYKTQEKNN